MYIVQQNTSAFIVYFPPLLLDNSKNVFSYFDFNFRYYETWKTKMPGFFSHIFSRVSLSHSAFFFILLTFAGIFLFCYFFFENRNIFHTFIFHQFPHVLQTLTQTYSKAAEDNNGFAIIYGIISLWCSKRICLQIKIVIHRQVGITGRRKRKKKKE